MSKQMKQMVMDELIQRVGDARDMLVVDSSRLDAIAANRLRLALREKDITLLTVRNSLARRAFRQAGFDTLDPFLEGPSTLAWGGEDIVALSKEIARWAKDLEPLAIKGGSLDGASLTSEEVDAVSKWPSREELLSIVSGQLTAVASEIASQIVGPAAEIAGQIARLIEMQGGESDEAAAAGEE